MAPELVRDGWSCTRDAGALLLVHPQRGELVLLGLAAKLYDLADGRRSAGELAILLEAVPEDIFAALDELADHGLLRARVAPPAAVRGHSRREVLGVLAGAAAVLAAPPLAAAAPAPVDETAAAGTIARQNAELVAAVPPREHVHKESACKSEQQRKLNGSSLASTVQVVTAEESVKAEADMLGAWEAAAKRADSPAESAEKQSLEFPPALAGARESDRKQSVAPLVAEEESAKKLVHKRMIGLTDQAAVLSAREQHTKLAGDFGVAHEQTHKALGAARAHHRQLADEQAAKQVQRAQEARWKADVAEGRREEQNEKASLRAREQHHKGRGQEQHVKQADEQREKHRAFQLERFKQRQAQHVQARETLAARARLDPAAEQSFKDQAGEETAKHDIVLVELKARENAAKIAESETRAAATQPAPDPG